MRMGESRQESSIKSLIHTAAAAATAAAADSSLILLSAQILVKQNILSFFLLLKWDEAKERQIKGNGQGNKQAVITTAKAAAISIADDGMKSMSGREWLNRRIGRSLAKSIISVVKRREANLIYQQINQR